MLNSAIGFITGYPFIYDLCQIVLEGDYHEEISKTMGGDTEKSVLDIGCGTGYFSQFHNGLYQGVDSDERYIQQAAVQYGSDKRIFKVGDARKLDFPDNYFNASMIINIIHHLDDDAIITMLEEAKRVTVGQIYIFDMSTEPVSFLTHLLLSLDNGKHMRNLNEQVRLVERVAKVDGARTFGTPRGLLAHTAIVCH